MDEDGLDSLEILDKPANLAIVHLNYKAIATTVKECHASSTKR